MKHASINIKQLKANWDDHIFKEILQGNSGNEVHSPAAGCS